MQKNKEIKACAIKGPMFKPGDKVWAIGQDMVDVRNKCAFCGGTGKAIGKDMNEITCPVCEGTKTLISDMNLVWNIFRTFKIGKVLLTLDDENGKIARHIAYPYENIAFSESHCFGTKRDALLACNELNKNT